MMRVAVIALAMLVPIAAGATDRHFSVALPVKVSGSAFTTLAATSTRTTDAIDVTGLDTVTFTLVFTDADSSVTSVGMTCQTSETGSAPWADVQSCAVASGACTSSDASWAKASPGTKNWPWTVDLGVAKKLRCAYTFAGVPAAADTLTLTALGGAQ